MPIMMVSESVICFLTFFGSREIGMIQVEHSKSSIAVSENMVSLTVKVALVNRDCCVVCC